MTPEHAAEQQRAAVLFQHQQQQRAALAAAGRGGDPRAAAMAATLAGGHGRASASSGAAASRASGGGHAARGGSGGGARAGGAAGQMEAQRRQQERSAARDAVGGGGGSARAAQQALLAAQHAAMAGQQAPGGHGGAQPPAAKRARHDSNAAAGGATGAGAGGGAANALLAPPPAPVLVERGKAGSMRPPGAAAEGTSLCECFDADGIRLHLASLRLADKTMPANVRRREADSAAMLAAAPAGNCRACCAARLVYDPAPMYCGACGVRIKVKAQYFGTSRDAETTKQCFCAACYSGFGASVTVEGVKIPKVSLLKLKNEEDLEEPWVACDVCGSWVHQVCVLFNARRDTSGESCFTCPACILDQLSRVPPSRAPTPADKRPSSQQPAEALPRCGMSGASVARKGGCRRTLSLRMPRLTALFPHRLP